MIHVRGEGTLLAVVALGGGIGALARYGIAHAIPTREMPWATLITNVLGCLLIGILMVLITEVAAAHRLLRPFLGVGVLGGFTTFSTYAVEVRGLLASGSYPIAFVYLVGTVLAALAAVLAGVWGARYVTGAFAGKGD
ncbi:fluoride efflux transporter CrcB [Rhodococcus sp. NPDC058514]|uniref:fluoride efflux transporter CrcB n=1 Tax=unclassified Rhodococcus (in: high G+C Gram-positive bacteria) TaxID=192944 RepID=UPI0036665717